VPQPDNLAVDNVREHRREPLAVPALNLVESEVAWLPFWAGAMRNREQIQVTPLQ